MATRQSSRNSAATQPAACPTSKIDRGPREKRPVVPLSILRTHWIKERRLCAVKAYLLATHSDAPAIRARHQTGMQSHGGPQLVAELPQSLKNATASKYFGLSNVRYGSLADILTSPRHVRLLTPNNGRCAPHPSQHFMSTRPSCLVPITDVLGSLAGQTQLQRRGEVPGVHRGLGSMTRPPCMKRAVAVASPQLRSQDRSRRCPLSTSRFARPNDLSDFSTARSLLTPSMVSENEAPLSFRPTL